MTFNWLLEVDSRVGHNCFQTKYCPNDSYRCNTDCKAKGFHFGGDCFDGLNYCCRKNNVWEIYFDNFTIWNVCTCIYTNIVFEIFIKISWKINIVISIKNNNAMSFYFNEIFIFLWLLLFLWGLNLYFLHFL
jgi:hypothetical protein